jgi:hypothetical protein
MMFSSNHISSFLFIMKTEFPHPAHFPMTGPHICYVRSDLPDSPHSIHYVRMTQIYNVMSLPDAVSCRQDILWLVAISFFQNLMATANKIKGEVLICGRDLELNTVTSFRLHKKDSRIYT